jgi:hypothetical protein
MIPTLPSHFDGAPVLWSQHAAAPLQLRIAPAETTIAEIVATTPDLPFGFDEVGTVRIGGHIIPRENWHRVRPFAGDPNAIVTLEIDLGKGGNIFAAVAALVVALAQPNCSRPSVLRGLCCGSRA